MSAARAQKARVIKTENYYDAIAHDPFVNRPHGNLTQSVGALFFIFRMRYGAIGGRQILQSFTKIALCSAIMGLACWLGMHYTEFTRHSRFLVQLMTFLALIVGATALYLGLAWLFRCHEIEEIYGIATRRRSVASTGFAEP